MSGETVFVTDGQLRNALGVVRSLGARDMTVICGESTRFATAFFSKYVDETMVYPSPETSPEGFYSFLEELVQSRQVDVVLPVAHESTRIVSEHKEVLSRYTNVPTPDYATFLRGWDKGKTFQAAATADIPRPRTEYPSSTSEAIELADAIGYPVVVKARTASGSRGLRFVRSEDSFVDAYESVHSTYPHPLIQERIPQEGDMFGVAFVYNTENEVRAQFACEFAREYPPSGGPSTLHESIVREDILDYGRRLLEELQWEGVALVEFKYDPRDDTPKLMEVNPRFWSSHQLALFSGVDFPWLVFQHALGNDIPLTVEYEEGVRARYILPGDILRLLSLHDVETLRNFVPLFDTQTRYEIPNWDDKGPAFGRLAAMARFVVSPRMWRKAVLRQ